MLDSYHPFYRTTPFFYQPLLFMDNFYPPPPPLFWEKFQKIAPPYIKEEGSNYIHGLVFPWVNITMKLQVLDRVI